jgi:hypothetical protein
MGNSEGRHDYYDHNYPEIPNDPNMKLYEIRTIKNSNLRLPTNNEYQFAGSTVDKNGDILFSYQRIDYLGSPIAGCAHLQSFVNLKPPEGISEKEKEKYKSILSKHSLTVDPKYRDPKSHACFEYMKNFCVNNPGSNDCISFLMKNKTPETFDFICNFTEDEVRELSSYNNQSKVDVEKWKKICMSSCVHGACDSFMWYECHKPHNKKNPKCACILSKVNTVNGVNPFCIDKDCIRGGYATKGMLHSICPKNICTQIINVQKVKGDVSMEDINLEQNCGNEGYTFSPRYIFFILLIISIMFLYLYIQRRRRRPRQN